jgi:hypothetical protein
MLSGFAGALYSQSDRCEASFAAFSDLAATLTQ